MARLHNSLAKETTSDGGILRCPVCGYERPIVGWKDVSRYLSSGWPKCCGQTMHWVAARAEAAAICRVLWGAAEKARDLMRQHWSNNPNWRSGQEHTYIGQADIALEDALAAVRQGFGYGGACECGQHQRCDV